MLLWKTLRGGVRYEVVHEHGCGFLVESLHTFLHGPVHELCLDLLYGLTQRESPLPLLLQLRLHHGSVGYICYFAAIYLHHLY